MGHSLFNALAGKGSTMPGQPSTVLAASYDDLIRIIVALLAGVLVGIEREKARITALSRRKQEDQLSAEERLMKEIPGLRTFSLISTYAALTGLLYSKGLLSSTVFAVSVAVFGAVVTLYAYQRLVIARAAGVTTIMVMLVTFGIGLLAGLGEVVLAASLAVLTTLMLAIKLPAERIVGKMKYEELLWGLELGVVLIVVGPPVMASNITILGVPIKGIYLFFALVLTTSYLGYVAVKLKGMQGMAYLALVGGMANSEAAVMSCTSMAPKEKLAEVSLHSTVLSNSAMALRNLVIALGASCAASPYPACVIKISPLLVASLAPTLLAPISWLKMSSIGERVPAPLIENPLQLGRALKSTLVYLAIAVTAEAVREVYGITALTLVALVGGFVSSSAVILTLFTLPIPLEKAAVLSIYALLSATLNKALFAYLGSSRPIAALSALAGSAAQAVLVAAPLAASLAGL